LPFVTTPVGAEGLPMGNLRSSLVTNEPADLAILAGRLYSHREMWERAQQGLLEVARARFGRGSFQRTLIEALSHVGVAPPPGLSAGIADLAES
jgi:hypothetical protein